MSSEVTAGQDPNVADSRAPSHPWLILILLCLAQFMVILDIMVMQVALPEIGQSLNMDRAALTWVITSYTVTFGGLLILGGRLADAVGRRTTFLTGLAVFTIASLTAGLATGGPMLLTSRVAQGIGAAVLSPSALSILTTIFTGKERNRALGIWGAISAAGAAVGFVIGGALTSGPGWEWVFYINIPVGVLIFALVPALVPAQPREAGARTDILGGLIGTAATASLIYGLIRAGDTGWTSATALLPVGLAVLLGIGFVLVERRTSNPLMPLGLVRRPPLPGAVAMMVVATGVLLGMYFAASVYLQHAEGYSALRTGLVFLPVAVATAVGAHLAAGHLGMVGPRPIGAAAMALSAVGLALMAWIGVGGNTLTALLPGFVLAGIGLGAAFVTAITSGLSSVPAQHAGVASGILNTGHELGASLGIAVISTIAAAGFEGPAGKAAASSAALTSFEHAFLAAAIGAAVLALAAVVLLPKGRLAPSDGPVFIH
ncbi:MFS transporter [Micromonospora sp. SL1-18]|uniref:MFS transporter n=1 Tax=Micromonospora sp. SL1-18 TaxID=3399128 RepID=UPI003A4E15B3